MKTIAQKGFPGLTPDAEECWPGNLVVLCLNTVFGNLHCSLGTQKMALGHPAVLCCGLCARKAVLRPRNQEKAQVVSLSLSGAMGTTFPDDLCTHKWTKIGSQRAPLEGAKTNQ